MTTYVLNVNLCKMSKQDINIKTICPNYILKFRNTNSHLLQVYIDVWAKIETVKE